MRVTDEFEAPVANVAVTVTHGQQSNTANTDQSGRAVFPDVAVGTAMVAIAVPAQYRSTETSRQLTVTQGPNTITTTFAMTLRAATISLSVVDSTGGYVPDVQFEIGNGSPETAGTWEAMTRMPNGRSYAGAAVLGDAVYVLGGSSSRATTHEDPGTNTVQRFILR